MKYAQVETTIRHWYKDGQWYEDYNNQCDEYGENGDYDTLEALIREVFGDYVDVEVQNFGWQNMNGHKDGISTANPLRDILPNCECTFKWRLDGDRMWIDNAHHDSPVGGEIYTITKGVA